MTRTRHTILLLLICILVAAVSQTADGVPASSFTLRNGDWYDNFGINRNYYGGPDGFMPNLADETLSENKELAYSIGERFQNNYPSITERAAAILEYVQTWTDYGYDSDNVIRNDIAQDEWAWNADEMAHALNETTGIKAIGDCEDMAFLGGTIYVGAGFDTALVLTADHVALLIWLPEFPNADIYWNLPNDDRDAGWIWVEATGKSNRLGWTPPDFEDGGWIAYPIGPLEFTPATQPGPSQSTSIDFEIMATIILMILVVLLALAGSKRGR